jgi:hypothetical protein
LYCLHLVAVPPTPSSRMQVKFSELTLDTFRMLQAVEWEPSGQFLKTRASSAQGAGPASSSSSAPHPPDGGPGPRENNRPGGVLENVIDPSLPANPHKYLLYRPTVPQVLLVRAGGASWGVGRARMHSQY